MLKYLLQPVSTVHEAVGMNCISRMFGNEVARANSKEVFAFYLHLHQQFFNIMSTNKEILLRRRRSNEGKRGLGVENLRLSSTRSVLELLV